MSLEFRQLLIERKIMPPNVGGMTHALRVRGALQSASRSGLSSGPQAVRRRLKAAKAGGPTKSQLRRQQTLAKRRAALKAGGAKQPKRARFDATTMRPRTLGEARTWARQRSTDARIASTGGDARRYGRLERRHQAAQAVLAQWEAAKRPPKGFRRRR